MRFIMGFLLVLGLAAIVEAQHLDRSDPEAVALAFVEAYQARDLPAVAPLMNATNRSLFDALAEQGRDHPAYEDVFSGWRAEAVDGAEDLTGAPRYRANGEAMVPIGAAEGETFVIALTTGDDGWAVEDILSPATSDFEALPTTP